MSDRKVHVFSKVHEGSKWTGRTACGVQIQQHTHANLETIADHKAPSMCGERLDRKGAVHTHGVFLDKAAE